MPSSLHINNSANMLLDFAKSGVLSHATIIECENIKEVQDKIKEDEAKLEGTSDSKESVDGSDSGDELYDQIVDFVVKSGKASASLLQRKFKIGYNRAATMIDLLEENGIIGPATGNSKPREVLVQFSEENEEE